MDSKSKFYGNNRQQKHEENSVEETYSQELKKISLFKNHNMNDIYDVVIGIMSIEKNVNFLEDKI